MPIVPNFGHTAPWDKQNSEIKTDLDKINEMFEWCVEMSLFSEWNNFPANKNENCSIMETLDQSYTRQSNIVTFIRLATAGCFLGIIDNVWPDLLILTIC